MNDANAGVTPRPFEKTVDDGSGPGESEAVKVQMVLHRVLASAQESSIIFRRTSKVR